MKLIFFILLFQTDPDSVLLKKYPKEYKVIYELNAITDSTALAKYRLDKIIKEQQKAKSIPLFGN